MYSYLKALHIVFVVTWFAGLFYMPRLLIYIIEANEKAEQERKVIQSQLVIMLRRLWFGITWPSAVITLIFGVIVMIEGSWWKLTFEKDGIWLLIKLILVVILYAYHYSLHYLYRKTVAGEYPYSAQAIRYWNELPTLLLIAIVTLVVVKQWTSFLWVTVGMLLLILVLFAAIKLYKNYRKKHEEKIS